MKSQVLVGKVFVGMSGGVDSSVSAALLKKAGYAVTGVFIKVWQPDFIECTWKEDRLDAMRVCAKLGIPFITLDLSKEYKRDVVDYMVAEYRAGQTPNPDVMCNRHVKFGAFYQWAMERGVDYVATGHYARIVKRESYTANRRAMHDTRYTLCSGADSVKDQSYFLWQIRKEQLPHILFPVGGMTKPEVRELAKKFGLPTAEKKDSQGLCFLGKIDVKEFLKSYIKPKKGNVLNESGEVVGTHDGAFFYTIGERHGFEITKKTPNDKPYYVVGKDVKKNTLTISDVPHTQSEDGEGKVFELKGVSWIRGVPPARRQLSARVRYRQPLQKCRTSEVGHLVDFVCPQIAAAGQSVVFYDGEVCLGGGVIV